MYASMEYSAPYITVQSGPKPSKRVVRVGESQRHRRSNIVERTPEMWGSGSSALLSFFGERVARPAASIASRPCNPRASLEPSPWISIPTTLDTYAPLLTRPRAFIFSSPPPAQDPDAGRMDSIQNVRSQFLVPSVLLIARTTRL